MKDKSAASIVTHLESLFKTVGAPRLLWADGARENRGATVSLLCQTYGVRTAYTAPHSSQQNGGVERVHQTIKALLRRLLLEAQGAGLALDLSAALEAATAQYNRTQHSVTGMPPFTAFYGRPPPPVLPPTLIQRVAAHSTGSTASQAATSDPRGGSRTRDGRSVVSKAGSSKFERAELKRLGTSVVSEGPRQRRPSVLGVNIVTMQVTRAPLQSRMSAVDAARQRLGLANTSSSAGAAASVLRAASSQGAGAGSAPREVPATVQPTVRRVAALAYDARKGAILYLLQHSAPYEAEIYDAWEYAASFGVTDPQLQAELKRSQKDAPPVIFSQPFHGPPELDRGKPIPRSVVINEVSRGDDGEDEEGAGGAHLDDDQSGQESVEDSGEATSRAVRPQRSAGAGTGAGAGAARGRATSARRMQAVASAAADAAVAAMTAGQDDDGEQEDPDYDAERVRTAAASRGGKSSGRR